jgi:hypothetical protein
VRAFNDPKLDSEDSALYLHKISYDSDVSKLPKLVKDSKGKYTLV